MINLSASILSQEHVSVLSRGLNYCPTTKFNLLNTLLDVNKLAQNLTLHKHFFQDKKDSLLQLARTYTNITTEDNQFMTFEEQRSICILRSLQQENESIPIGTRNYKPIYNSSFYPIHSRPTTLDTFQELVERDLTKLYEKIKDQPEHNNLTKKRTVKK